MNAVPPNGHPEPGFNISRAQIAEYRELLRVGVGVAARIGQPRFSRAIAAGEKALALLDAIIEAGTEIGIDRAIEQIAAQAAADCVQKISASGVGDGAMQALLDAFGSGGSGVVGPDDDIEDDGFRTVYPRFAGPR